MKRIASAAIIVLLLAMAIHLLPGSTTLSQEGGFIYERYGYPGYAVLLGYEGPGGAVEVPSQLGGHPVYGIGLRAFAERGDITSVSIPQCVSFIGKQAFFECTGLESLEVPSSVDYIGTGPSSAVHL